MRTRILLLTPPMTQLNTPYPASAYLTGFLRSRGIEAAQADPALELVLRLFSAKGLERVHAVLTQRKGLRLSPSIQHFLENFEAIRLRTGPVLRFLQGKDPSLAVRIAARNFLPEGPRFRALYEFSQGAEGGDLEQLQWAFGTLGLQDQAKYLATLFLDDLADVIQEGVDGRFQLSRYGEKLAASQATFDALEKALETSESTLIDEMLEELTQEIYERFRPEVVALSMPFPGNVYGGLRMARTFKRLSAQVRVIAGGGYPNTELRELSDPRIFQYLDAITLDDGERPILNLLEYFDGKRGKEGLLRTFLLEEGRVAFHSSPKEHDIPQHQTGTPTYDGLPLTEYLSIFEMLNPMHRIWSDGRWNKLTLAHGCYWKKCNFCDVSLDYIGRYQVSPVELTLDRMEALVRETGQSGFHFVDEAAPPALLRELAQGILRRGLTVTWWGNVRFEKAFTPELCELLARSGCIAFSGGLEVASDRLLKLMNKGVSVEQVARVTRAMSDAGILVHAYLMYGFPTQTEQETVDALERVRQLFEAGCIQSAYWHRFSATVHSPIGREPSKFGITVQPPRVAKGRVFARNDLPFQDPTGTDHDLLGAGLRRALYNYMNGTGLDQDVRVFFDRKVPRAKVAPDFVVNALELTDREPVVTAEREARIISSSRPSTSPAARSPRR